MDGAGAGLEVLSRKRVLYLRREVPVGDSNAPSLLLLVPSLYSVAV